MKSKRRTIQSLGYLTLVFTVALVAMAGYAQRPYWQRPGDPRMVVIPVRSMEEITTDLDNAKATRQLVMNRNTQAVNRLNETKRAIQDREALIKDIDRREGDAKDDRRNTEAVSLKIELKANKKAIDLLKRLKNLREAEIDVAKAEEEHVDLEIRVFQMESELQSKRSEYNWQSTGSQNDLTQNTAGQVIGELEVSLLKLQEELASATQKVASKQKDVVKERMRLHKAQVKLGI